MNALQFLTEASVEGKNTHMTHIEDLVLYAGESGIQNAIASLASLADMLGGSSSVSHDVTVKFDGCVAPDTLLTLDNGTQVQIGVYVDAYTDSENSPKVLCYDEDTSNFEFASVDGVFRKYGDKRWLEITLESGDSLRLTEDHEVFTQRGWIESKNLLESDVIISAGDPPI
jgi:hypothetical protein